MKEYKNIKNRLLEVNSRVLSLISAVSKIPYISEQSCENWRKNCYLIENQVGAGIIRIAVVGTIKSGKSTLINSIFKGDYLKRGAGVVTSIVTKIKKGDSLRAILYFKPLKDINEEIEKSLAMFPGFQSNSKPFNIQNSEDREKLYNSIKNISPEILINKGERNANIVLLENYLKGYQKVKNFIGEEKLFAEYKDKDFDTHKKFVGDDCLSVYLKDVHLEIDSDTAIEKDIEIADCQGSDSSNPLHLFMIQQYLIQTNFIIYVISSRTGLREADIKFLSTIKKMGIIENIIFVVNIDLSEHENIENLKKLINTATQQITLIKKEPSVFSFSALYNLLDAKDSFISSRDEKRLDSWKEEENLIDFSNSGAKLFKEEVERKLKEEKLSLFLRNNIERLSLIWYEIKDMIDISKKLISKDSTERAELINQIKDGQTRINSIKDTIKPALDGALIKIKKDIKEEVDIFFSESLSGATGKTVDFIREYGISYDEYLNLASKTDFSNCIYAMFQEISGQAETYITQQINPELINFSKDLELKILKGLQSIADPFFVMINQAACQYKGTSESLNPGSPDIREVKKIAGLNLVPIKASMKYSAKMKTEAFMHLFLNSTLNTLRKIFKKQEVKEADGKITALKSGGKRIKKEIENAVKFHFKNYKENFKFQYICRFAEALSETFHSSLINSFQDYTADFSVIAKSAGDKESENSRVLELLENMRSDSENIGIQLEELKKDL